MAWWLEWDAGDGRLIRAGYSSEDEAATQAAADEEQFPGRGGVVTDTPTLDAPVEELPVEEPAPNLEG